MDELKGAAIAAATAFLYWLAGYIKKKTQFSYAQKKTIEGFSDRQKIKAILDDLWSKIGCSYVLLLKVNDTHDLHDPTATVYSSVVSESEPINRQPIKPTWKEQEITEQYQDMLLELMQNGVLDIKLSTIQDPILKTAYQSNGIAASRLSLVHFNKAMVAYISCPRDSETPLTPKQKNDIRIATNQLRNLLRKTHQ